MAEFRFYHISRDASEDCIADFLENGISAGAGTGYGGQKAGFYVWTDEKRANAYFLSLVSEENAEWAKQKFGIDIKLSQGKALKIEVSQRKEDIKFPKWQLDSEQHPNQAYNRERSILLDMWSTQKGFFKNSEKLHIPFKCGKGEGVITSMGWNEQNNCPAISWLDKKTNRLTSEIFNNTHAEVSGLTQAVNDYLCNNNEVYKKDYDDLIYSVAANEKEHRFNTKLLNINGLAIKYCGDEPLRAMKICLMTGKVTERFGKRLSASEKEVSYRDYKIAYDETPLTQKPQRLKIKDLLNEPAAKADDLLSEAAKTDKLLKRKAADTGR